MTLAAAPVAAVRPRVVHLRRSNGFKAIVMVAERLLVLRGGQETARGHVHFVIAVGLFLPIYVVQVHRAFLDLAIA